MILVGVLFFFVAIIFLLISIVRLIKRDKVKGKKNAMIGVVSAVFSIILISVGASGEETTTPTTAEAKTEEKVPQKQENNEVLVDQDVLDYTANITGAPFLKEVIVGDKNIDVQFHDTFESYKSAKPQSKVSKEDYIEYFSTGDQINKILMEESVRLLKQFTAADNVSITVPFEGKTYSVKLEKSVAETYFNVDFDTLNSDPEAWRSELSNKYFNKKDRQAFVDEFVQVK